MDLRSGFHQIKVHVASQAQTTFDRQPITQHTGINRVLLLLHTITQQNCLFANKLLKKHSPWVWEVEQQQAYYRLKAEISTEGRILQHQDPNKPMMLQTDWSKEVIGAVLGQIDDEGREYMIVCISRSLNVHERNYSSPQGEMLASVWAVKTFHTYLHGQQFTLVTDHQPLTYMMTKNVFLGIFARWAKILQQYTFTIIHRPDADGLSRQPQDSSMDTSGGRLYDEYVHAPKCTLMLQLQAMQAVVDHDSLQQVFQSLCFNKLQLPTLTPMRHL